MRTAGKVLLAVTLCFGVVALSSGQQGGGKKGTGRPGGGFRGGFGGGGGFGGNDPASMLRNPAVRKELGVSDEQLQALPEAYMKAVAQILDADQMKRFRQIQLQQKGSQAFADADVQKDLKFSSKQKADVKSILSSYRESISELGKGDGDFRERFEKMRELRKQTDEKLEGVLTSSQRTAWTELVGEKFEMPAFGGGGRFPPKGKGTRKKATDE